MIDDRIFKCCDRTAMVLYTCRNHPELRWMSKNIHNRSLFFNGVARGYGLPMTYYVTGYVGENNLLRADGTIVRECECPADDLIHVCR